MNLNDIRQEYMQKPFDIKGFEESPLKLLENWYNDAIKENITLVNAITLSTIGLDGSPNSRVVLSKEIDSSGMTIFTDYDSEKGCEIEKNPSVAITIFWKELDRQIRIRGKASKISSELSTKYFQSRPKESQISSTASLQSKVVSLNDLNLRVEELTHQYANESALPRPMNWGGYKIDIGEIEFWQGRPNRLHDRFKFLKVLDSWQVDRLSP